MGSFPPKEPFPTEGRARRIRANDPRGARGAEAFLGIHFVGGLLHPRRAPRAISGPLEVRQTWGEDGGGCSVTLPKISTQNIPIYPPLATPKVLDVRGREGSTHLLSPLAYPRADPNRPKIWGHLRGHHLPRVHPPGIFYPPSYPPRMGCSLQDVLPHPWRPTHPHPLLPDLLPTFSTQWAPIGIFWCPPSPRATPQAPKGQKCTHPSLAPNPTHFYPPPTHRPTQHNTHSLPTPS